MNLSCWKDDDDDDDDEIAAAVTMVAFFFNSLRSLSAIYKSAQIDLINLRNRTLQITLLFGHGHATHSAVKYINVYVNIYDVAVVVPWVWWM